MERKKQVLLIFMCWLLYTVAYIGRYSYSANIISIQKFFNKSEMAMGAIGSFFFFSYGAGQVVNGLLCRHYNPKYVLSISILSSAIINFVIYLNIIPFEYLKFLWLLNGISQSFLWTLLILTLSKNLDEKYIKIAIVAMSTTTSVGTLFTYGFAGIIGDNFTYSFLFATISMGIVGIAWFFMCDKMIDKNLGAVAIEAEEIKEIPKPKKMDKSVIKILILFGIVAIMVNFIKDGIMTWVPSVLNQSFSLSDSISKIMTMVLPVLGIFGTTFVVFLHKKVKEYSSLTAITFLCASIFIGAVVLLLETSLWILVLLALGMTSMLMSGANNIVNSIIPLDIREKANSGLVAGILDGCCYVGSALSSVGMGALKEYFGSWNPVFNVLLILSVFVVALCFIVYIVKKMTKKQRTIN